MQTLLGTGSGGGISSLSLTVPSTFGVLGAPCTTGPCNLQLFYASNQAANQVLRTPDGSTGALSLGSLNYDYLPTLSGDFSISGTTGTIAANAVTLAKEAQAPADTVPCNITGAQATLTYCTQSQLQSFVSGSSSGDPQIVELCTQSGVDPTGVTDSRAAVQSAITANASTTQKIVVNCPIKITLGYDYTKPVFIPSNVDMEFGPNGYFIVDNLGMPAFVLEDSTDVTIRNLQIEYVGQFGTQNIYGSGLPAAGSGSIFNNTTLKTWATANRGITFGSSQNPYWSGAVNICAIVEVRGGTRLNFQGGRIFAAPGTNVANYAPVVFSFNIEWNPNQTVANGVEISPSIGSYPDSVTVSDFKLDGYLMGFVGGVTNGYFHDVEGFRYADLQDGTSGTITLSSVPSNGATSGTLATAWPNQSGYYALCVTQAGCYAATSTNYFITYLTQGSTSMGTFSPAVSGSPSSATFYSGNIGGVGSWFAPPHLFYMDSDVIDSTHAFPSSEKIANIIDFGIRAPTSLGYARPSSSGSALSMKIEPDNNTVVENYTTLRPDGCADLLTQNGYSNGTIRGFYCSYNSNLATVDGNYVWGIRFPSTLGFNNLSMPEFTIIDTAAAPTQFPVIPFSQAGNSDVVMAGWHVFLNDWPAGATWYPGFEIAGNQMYLDADIHFNQTNSSQTFRGVFNNQGNALLTNSKINISVTGFRQFTLTFNAALGGSTTTTAAQASGNTITVASTAGITSGTVVTDATHTGAIPANTTVLSIAGNVLTLSATVTGVSSGDTINAYATGGTLASAWTQPTGIYQAQFSNQNLRYVTLTNGSTAVSSFAALTSAATATGFATNALTVANAANYNAYKNRVTVGQSGNGDSNYVHILDVTNNVEQTVESGIDTESLTQIWYGTPSGATDTTPIYVPSNFSVEKTGWAVTTALTGSGGTLTGVNVGCSGNASAYLSNANVSTTNVGVPLGSPSTTCSGANTTITPIGATALTGGVLQLSQKMTSVYGTP
jgi:hypothetical protein